MLRGAFFKGLSVLWCAGRIFMPSNRTQMNSFRPIALCLGHLCVLSAGIATTTSAVAQTDALPPCQASFDIYDGAGTYIASITEEGQEINVCNADFLVLDFQNTSTPTVGAILTLGHWDLGGSIISNLLDQQYQFGSDALLPVSFGITDSDLCMDMVSVNIRVLGQPGFEYDAVEPTCFGLCDGSLSGIYLSNLATAYTHTWFLDGTEIGSGNWFSSMCGGNYTVEVIDVGGCTLIQQDFTLDEPPAVFLEIMETNLLEICPGDDAVFFNPIVGNAALPLQSVSWSWPDGLTNPDALYTMFTPSTNNVNQFLELSVVDANGCEGVTGILIKPRKSNLTGQVLINGAPCTGCQLECYKLADAGVWSPWVGASTSGTGAYAMNNIGGLVDCIMRVIPPEVTYPDLPTLYYVSGGVTHRWSDATVLTTGCGIENSLIKNVSTSTLTPLNGQTTIEGAVFYQYTGKVQAEDPIPGVDVVVEKVPPGNSLSVVTTDSEGRFSFNFVPQTLGDTVYNFYVDLPGVPMEDNYFLSVSANDVLIQNVHFCLIEDSTAIQTCSVLAVSGPQPVNAASLSVFPNPAGDMVRFRVSGPGSGVDGVSLLDLTGRVVRHFRPEGPHFEMSVQGLSAGLYSAVVSMQDGTVLSERLLVGR